MEETRGDLTLSLDSARMDVDVIHRYLATESYWAFGIPKDVVARSIAHSLCVGVFDGQHQVGFARVITDRATYAYLCDVFVLATHRRRGIASWMMEAIDRHPDLQGLRRWNLVTRDAHDLYRTRGYVTPSRPEGYMERLDRDVYTRAKAE